MPAMTTPKGDRTPVVLLEEIFPGDTNAYGTAFGGKILALMDRAAGLAASRYAHGHFVTASMDTLVFHAPVLQGQIAEVCARVVYTSARTCGLQVEVSAVEKETWSRQPCCRGLIFMVARGPEGKLLPVPPLKLTTPEERKAWELAAGVHRRMLEGRAGTR
jgi:acyl-CoA hydrolase